MSQSFLLNGFMTIQTTPGQRSQTDYQFNGRVAFEIEQMQNGLSASGTTLKAWNMSDQSRGLVEQANQTKNQIASLYAGYGDDIGMICTGQYFHAFTERDNADWVTTIQLHEGIELKQLGNLSITGARNNLDIFNQIANKLQGYGLSIGAISSSTMSIMANHVHPKKYSELASIDELLNQITVQDHLKYSVVNGELNIHDLATDVDNLQVVLTPNTGLIEIPSKTDHFSYKVTSLLNRNIVPGRKIQVQSEVLGNWPKGAPTILQVLKVKHSGDTLLGKGRSEVDASIPQYYYPLVMQLNGAV